MFVAKGVQKPKPPFLFFQTFQAETYLTKYVLGQLLIAMVEAQIMNNAPEKPIFDCYNIGRFWFFVVLIGKEYGVSAAYNATQTDDLTDMVSVVKF